MQRSFSTIPRSGLSTRCSSTWQDLHNPARREGQASQAQIGAFLLALHMKGETTAEIAAFARVMRDHAITVQT